MFQNIPDALKALPQWVTWRYETIDGSPKPTKPLYNPRNGWKASHSDPQTWSDFATVVAAVDTGHYNGIGFVLAESDPFAFIDLDTYDPKLSPEDRERHTKIAHMFDSYAELSPSGQGLHIIVRGTVPAGRKRRGVEVYSSLRYMTMTGNVWRPSQINDQQELLTTLWDELQPDVPRVDMSHVNEHQTEEDGAICTKAYGAVNGQKFLDLYQGRWEQSYSSQSEADFALIDIIAYYTKNRDQIKRIFRSSALGQRDKAKREDYVSMMLNRAFDNQPPAVDFTALAAQAKASFEANLTPEPVGTIDDDNPHSVPPGFVGELAKYFYSSAPRQVPEIALCAALGLMAGVCGRAYNISGTGLNHYLMLLAPTGSGKEAMASGVARLMTEVEKIVPASSVFIGPGEIRSDAALLKYMSKKSASFISIGGEFGHTLQQMASPFGSSVVKGVKRLMLDLYGKSGQGNVLRPTIYSDADKSTLAIGAPAFSFIGESAPESFYNSVDETIISDGLLPRFTLIEYKGDQMPVNKNAGHLPDQRMVENMGALCALSLQLNQAGKCIDVKYVPEAKQLLDDFEVETRGKINVKENTEVIRHIWNRAHLRALKLAGLLAVGEHPYEPTVTEWGARWAINLSSYNTQRLLEKFESGEIGATNTDDSHMREVRRMVKKWLSLKSNGMTKFEPFKVHMHANSVVPFAYIQQNLISTSAFRHAKNGGTTALRNAIKNLISNGELIEYPKQKSFEVFKTNAECYAIASAVAFRTA